jgi:hypothetical protein
VHRIIKRGGIFNAARGHCIAGLAKKDDSYSHATDDLALYTVDLFVSQTLCVSVHNVLLSMVSGVRKNKD